MRRPPSSPGRSNPDFLYFSSGQPCAHIEACTVLGEVNEDPLQWFLLDVSRLVRKARPRLRFALWRIGKAPRTPSARTFAKFLVETYDRGLLATSEKDEAQELAPLEYQDTPSGWKTHGSVWDWPKAAGEHTQACIARSGGVSRSHAREKLRAHLVSKRRQHREHGLPLIHAISWFDVLNDPEPVDISAVLHEPRRRVEFLLLVPHAFIWMPNAVSEGQLWVREDRLDFPFVREWQGRVVPFTA